MRMLFKWKNDWTVDNHRSHQWAWNGLTQGWDIQGDRLLVQGWPMRQYRRYKFGYQWSDSVHGQSHDIRSLLFTPWMTQWIYVGMISVYNIELNLDFGIDTLASVLYISSLRVKTFVTYESWGSTSLQVSSHWSNLHRGLKPQTSQTWQDKWQSKILKSSQPTTHARKVKLVVSRRNQSMSILQVLKCFETKNINKNETMRTSAKCHTCQDQGSSISTCFAWQGLCHENLHPAISHDISLSLSLLVWSS